MGGIEVLLISQNVLKTSPMCLYPVYKWLLPPYAGLAYFQQEGEVPVTGKFKSLSVKGVTLLLHLKSRTKVQQTMMICIGNLFSRLLLFENTYFTKVPVFKWPPLPKTL